MFEHELNKMKRNKFYVGSEKVLEEKYRESDYKTWGHAELSDALRHANTLLEKNPRQEYCFIVEIIKVVRRKPVELPIIVEDV